MKFTNSDALSKELTYEDVFIMPQYSAVTSRMNVSLSSSKKLPTTNPVVVANMNAVAGKRMAESVARRGGLVVLPQDMNLERIERTVSYIKSRSHIYDTPISLSEHDTIQTALNLIGKRAHGAVVIIDHLNQPVGIFTEKDAVQHDRFTPLKEVMNTHVITIPEGTPEKEMFALLQKNRLSFAPVVDATGALLGAVTKKSIVRNTIYSPAVNSNGELLTSVAIGINKDMAETADFLKQIGTDVIVLDTAHGHQKRMIEAIAMLRDAVGPHLPIVAGNVVTPRAVEDLVSAGADIIKVGVGPGAMCTTRMMTGVGRPQFSAVYHCAQKAKSIGAEIWADGGVRHPRDVAIAVAAGASNVMFASWFAGTHESVGDLKYDEQGRPYKENFGMASKRAVTDRNDASALFEQARRQYFEEGISQSRMYLKPGEESVEDILDHITAGLRSACTYTGVDSIEAFQEHAVIGVQTGSGYNEGKPLHQSW